MRPNQKPVRGVDLSKLPLLKQKLLTEKKLGKVWEYFMDHFGDHAEFIQKSQQLESHDELQKLLIPVFKALFKESAIVVQWLIMAYPKEHFYHGVANTSAGIVNFIFYDDIRVGSTLQCAGLANGETRYTRFAAETLPDGGGKSGMN